ncbi:MAG: hypothetical protein CMJ45_00315 [Planctomyces sp.]|nr:hypothetical protein [Planctomyces sp.]
MITEVAGAGIIRDDVQQAIDRELNYRLGQEDAPGSLARWEKELVLLVLHTVKANACLSQLHARAAVKAGATLAQVLQVIQYVELTGMVKWVMAGHDALTAAEAEVPEAQRVDATKDAWAGQEQRFQDIQQYLQRDGHAEIRQYYPDTAVMMLTGVEDLSIAVSAMQQGAYDYVNKPVRSLTELTLRIEQALSHRALVLENKRYQENLEEMVQERTAELEQRMRELNGLNGILRTELNQNIGKEEDHARLQKSLSGYGSQLLEFVQQLTSASAGPSEAANPTLHAAIIDCSGRLGELANRMIESDSADTGTGL